MDNVVFQVQLAKHQDSVPLTRDYISEYENARQPEREEGLRAAAVQGRVGYPPRTVQSVQTHGDTQDNRVEAPR